jgi:hypothetical protein
MTRHVVKRLPVDTFDPSGKINAAASYRSMKLNENDAH